MKAARFYCPGDLRVEEISKPSIGPRDVLVEVKACGVCGSDVHILHGETPVPKKPITLGHEFAGVVVEAGKDVEKVKIGDYVSVYLVIFCGECTNCITGRENICSEWKIFGIHEDGGLAEYVKVPEVNCVKIPKNLPFEYAAILTDAVLTPYHAIKLAKISPADVVAIYGVGGLGIHAVQLAKIFGAKVVAIDLVDYKLKTAKKFGVDETINAVEENPVEKLLNLTDGEGVDVAMEFVGKPSTIENTLNSVRRGGKAVLVGLTAEKLFYDTRLIVRREVNVLGSYAGTRKELKELVQMTTTGKLNLSNSITHKFHLEDTLKGLEVIERQIGNPIRVVIFP